MRDPDPPSSDPEVERHSDAERSPRHARMHALFDATRGRGLEIGPLHTPVVTRTRADVRYVDVYDLEGLLEIYRSHDGVPVDAIEDPDFVLMGPGGMRPLAEAVAPGAPYDWVVASHVVEHVPDVVTWLGEIADVLADDGALVLAIPDRRFCFDIHREPTTVGEILLARQSADERPSVRAIYDHFSRCMHINTARVWGGGAPGPRMYGLDFVQAQMALAERGDYVDCHVWTWTPASFVQQTAELAALGLLDVVVDQVLDTARDDLEFYVRLRRLPRGLDDAERVARQAASVQTWTDVEPPPPPQQPGGVDDDCAGVAATLSPSEARLVLAKRRVLYRARTLVKRRR